MRLEATAINEFCYVREDHSAYAPMFDYVIQVVSKVSRGGRGDDGGSRIVSYHAPDSLVEELLRHLCWIWDPFPLLSSFYEHTLFHIIPQ